MFVELSLTMALAVGQAPAGQAQTQTPPTPVVAAPAPKPAVAAVPAPAAQAQAARPPKAPAAPPPPALVGFWESEATSRGGIGTALLINADGSCDFTVVVKVDFKYSFDAAAGTLIFAGDAQGTPETTLPVTLTGDTLLVKPPTGDPITKTRVGAAADAERPLLGIWRYPHASGGTAWERYGADGAMMFRLATTERPSTCTVTGDRLAIDSPQMKTDARFEVKDDELRLFGPSEEARLFRRIAAGRWYGKADLTPPK
jgi:hypothetical protein